MNIIFIWFFLVAASFGYYFYVKNKSAEIIKDFNTTNQKENAPIFLEELLGNQFDFIKKKLEGIEIDAFTQAQIPVSGTDKAKNFAKDAAKTTALRMVGVKKTYTRIDAVCYFVLCAKNLHFLSYFNGTFKTHLTFNENDIINAKATKLEETQTQKIFDKDGMKAYQIIFNKNGETIKLNYRDRLTESIYDNPQLGVNAEFQKQLVKRHVVSLDFIEKLWSKYPNLKK